eukprot:10467318-Alexandrium_andersonii.AAC.1
MPTCNRVCAPPCSRICVSALQCACVLGKPPRGQPAFQAKQACTRLACAQGGQRKRCDSSACNA